MMMEQVGWIVGGLLNRNEAGTLTLVPASLNQTEISMEK